MGGEPRGRRSQGGAAMRALRGARDLYVRGIRGLDRLLAAASPRRGGVRLLAAASPRRGGVGRPASRAFGVGGGRDSEEELRELVRAMQARRGAAPSAGAAGSGKAEAGEPAVKRRGATPLERINEEEDAAAVVRPTRLPAGGGGAR